MLKTGDIIFVRNEFDIKNPGTWMGGSIRSVLNIDNLFTHKPKMYYNHVALILEIDGSYYVVEAGWNKLEKRGEVIKTPFNQWKNGRKEGSYLIKSPIFNFDSYIFTKTCLDQLGKKYDFTSVLLAQPVRQMTGRRLWLGSRTSLKRLYCSEFIGYAFHIATNKLGFGDYYELDPEDLFLSPLFSE